MVENTAFRHSHACASFKYKDHPMVVVAGGYHDSMIGWTTEFWNATGSNKDWTYLKNAFPNSKYV